MTKEAQRIAIAEACGWKRVKTYKFGKRQRLSFIHDDELPDYLNDLNAMYEAEQSIPKHLQNRYIDHLNAIQWREVTNEFIRFKEARATAAQRSEAFLKTIGKWNELA